MGRRLLLVFVLLLSAFAYADDWKKEYTVGANPELKVDTNDAGIEVHRGGPKIEAYVRTEGYKIAPGDVNIYEHQEGDRVSLRVSIPRQNFVFGWHNRSVHVVLNVPVNTKLDVYSGDGAISINGIAAPAQLSTADGRIVVSDFAGPLHARTHDGSIRVDGRFDDLDLSSGDGSIHCEIRNGSKMKNSWRVHTNDGSITLRVPDDLAADLSARTNDGHIRINLPGAVQSAADRDERREIRTKLNGGGYVLSVESGDGGIDILK
jgi:DUF4097 and DUF4098 domain-containing protein YvlB